MRSSRAPVRPVLALALSLIFLGPAGARTLPVWPDGHGSFATIERAIASASRGDTVLLGDGVFSGTGNHDIDFLGKDVVVRSQSDNAAACVIDCQASFTDNHRAMILHSHETAAARVQSITFRHGFEHNNDIILGYGGAIFVWNSAVTVSRCVFEQNSADIGGGGAIAVWQGSAEIDDCVFRGNAALGGGAVYIDVGPAVLQRCVLTGNAGHAGGAIAFDVDAVGTVLDCTISGNSAEQWGGGIADYGSRSWVYRTIIWGNCALWEGNDMALFHQSTSTIGCCCVSPDNVYVYGASAYWSGDPINADPAFCGAVACTQAPTTSGDYTLSGDSPCLHPATPCQRRIGALGQGCGISGVADQVQDGGRPARLDLQVTNPVATRMAVRVVAAVPGTATFTLVDASGRRIEKLGERSLPAGESRIEMPLSADLRPGWYLLVLDQGGERATRPVIRVR